MLFRPPGIVGRTPTFYLSTKIFNTTSTFDPSRRPDRSNTYPRPEERFGMWFREETWRVMCYCEVFGGKKDFGGFGYTVLESGIEEDFWTKTSEFSTNSTSTNTTPFTARRNDDYEPFPSCFSPFDYGPPIPLFSGITLWAWHFITEFRFLPLYGMKYRVAQRGPSLGLPVLFPSTIDSGITRGT